MSRGTTLVSVIVFQSWALISNVWLYRGTLSDPFVNWIPGASVWVGLGARETTDVPVVGAMSWLLPLLQPTMTTLISALRLKALTVRLNSAPFCKLLQL